VLGEGAATPATLDAALREGCGFPMGPFELMDLIGHDVNYAVTRSVFDAYFGDRRFTPSLVQHELVLAGRLGRKSGRGFYDYADGAAPPAPALEPAHPAQAAIAAVGELGPLAALADRLEAAGVAVQRRAGATAQDGAAPGWFEIGGARLALSDGRTATRRAAEEGIADLVLLDLCLDYARTPRLTLARADPCSLSAWGAVAGTLARTGCAVARIDDVAGLIGLRTVAMLANEAADAVLGGIGSAADIDTAMRYGTNYPQGPLAWADALGVRTVARVLAHLREHYGEERYRVSPLLQRLAQSGEGLFHTA
jgi:3-hydroxybutyryl-CoA dehydrogenase